MRGFTLVELLVATLVATLVSGAIVAVVQPMPALFQSQLEATDLQQRLRSATSAIGSALASAEAPVMPYRHGRIRDDPAAGVFYRPDTITAHSTTYYLRADQLMQYDGDRGDFPLIDNVVALGFDYFGDPRPPRRIAPPDGEENCLFTRDDTGQAIARLPRLAEAGLVRLTPDMLIDGPWCPDAITADRYDADLLRIRRVVVRLRLRVAHDSLRRLVPDTEISFSIAPANLQGEP